LLLWELVTTANKYQVKKEIWKRGVLFSSVIGAIWGVLLILAAGIPDLRNLSRLLRVVGIFFFVCLFFIFLGLVCSMLFTRLWWEKKGRLLQSSKR